jgi:hypothetical protein
MTSSSDFLIGPSLLLCEIATAKYHKTTDTGVVVVPFEAFIFGELLSVY